MAESNSGVRRSERVPIPTERMVAFRKEESDKKSRKFQTYYEQWKIVIRELRTLLKTDCDDNNMCKGLDQVVQFKTILVEMYKELQPHLGESNTIVRKVDACVELTKDISNIAHERISEIEIYDPHIESQRLKQLKKLDYAKSVFSDSTCSIQIFSEQLADVAADIAAKQTEMSYLEQEKEHNSKLAEIEYKHREELEAQKTKLKLMETRKNMEIANAKRQANTSAFETNIEVHGEHFQTYDVKQETFPSQARSSVYQCDYETRENTSTKPKDDFTDSLSKAIVESMNLSRLPVPEPFVFAGDSLRYLEWKLSFEILIERKGVPEQEKLFYLRKYVGGSAKNALEGFFYCNSQTAFKNAMQFLEERYGHPFVIQKAFRDKLERWPKINPKNPFELRNFADFLNGCKDAMVKVPSLQILNDCFENQKLLRKLPDWAIQRWNREVVQCMNTTGTYPLFKQFVTFVSNEAKVACHPVSSLYAIHNINNEQNITFENNSTHRNRAKVLATAAVSDISSTDLSGKRPIICEYCKGNDHYIFKCGKFLELSIKDRRVAIQKNNLCYGCLRKGHLNKDCKRKHTCWTCKGKHPSCLHEDRTAVDHLSFNTVQQEVRSASSFQVNRDDRNSTSMIVPVWVSHESNSDKEVLTYALLDTQSDTTFILNDTASAIGIASQPVKLSLSTMTSQNTIIDSSRISGLQIRGFYSKPQDKLSINKAYTRDFIPADRSHIPVKETVQDYSHLQSVATELAPLQSCEVGLLIGYNCPLSLAPLKVVLGQGTEPYAVQTHLGWSIVGYTKPVIDKLTSDITCHRISIKELPPCSPKDLLNVFETDFAGCNSNHQVSQQDIQFINLLDENILQREDKHLEMPLPFKQRPIMPNNKPLAKIRLSHLKRKLVRDKNYREHYNQFMKEMIDRGDCELVKSESTNKWYIPHHGVYHPKKPNKIRVVFDCSAKYHEMSLNQHLLSGPDLINGLLGILCRFRRYPIAIMCDVEKMFHQFIVSECDRDFLRFLWWEDGNLNTEPLEYRMKVHLFGAVSSPGCANFGMKYLAKNQEKQFPIASAFVQRDFYVDDGLTSVETEDEAISLATCAQKLCANGGLRLHKFVSNNVNVINSIPISEQANSKLTMNLALEDLPVDRALGIQWSTDDDMFSFNIKVVTKEATRRNMLSVVASIYDPLGFVAPFTFKGKRILQEMCRHGVGWDEPISDSQKPEWTNWINDIQNLKEVRISRCLKPVNFGIPLMIELHHLSDASNTGYGQCSYIKFVNESRVHCSLVMAKSRVAPLKVISIPRLELTAAVLSVKVSTVLREELELKIDNEYFWSDSQVALSYINNEARKFHVFVANRVQAIRNVTKPCQWNYVSSANNPADLASRGLSACEIERSTWLSGPSFLWEKEITYNQVKTDLKLCDPEVKQVRAFCTKTTDTTSILERLKRFSSWSRVVSVIARLQILAKGVKGKQSPTVVERQSAENFIIKLVQHEAFAETIKTLKNLPMSNKLYSLNPYLENELLRVGGRLKRASFPYKYRHPIILPKQSHITQLILADVHQRVQHQGRGITLNKLRSCGYWIVGGSKTVAKYIRDCVVCRKLRRPTEIQKMADLPQVRVDP